MKNDRQIYRRPRESKKGGPQYDRRLRGSCIPDRLGGCHIPVTGYDDSDHHEEKREIRHEIGLRNLCRYSRLGPPFGKPPTGSSESDVGESTRLTNPTQSDDRLLGGSPGVEGDAGRIMDERMSFELETTWMANDEIRHDRCLAMDSRRFQ